MVDFNDDGYELVEEWSYTDALQNKLQVTIKQADEAVHAIMYALQNNPQAFELVFGESVRVAHMSERKFDGLPAFRVFFRVHESEKKVVYLLHIDHG